MNVKNLRIGDSIQYQLPLFDPQEGKITKIYTDSVVINNNNHVSEKYIIKKVNKDKISLDDLKIGDRIKYKDKIAYCGTTTIKEIEVEGNILEIHDKFYQISDNDNRFDGKQLSVKKENIISKLEPTKFIAADLPNTPRIYKEIPIEKEIKFWGKIERVQHWNYPTSVTTYHCPKCDKQLWGTCGMPIKEYNQKPCKECKTKEEINNLLNKIPNSNSFEAAKLSGEVLDLTNQLVKEKPTPKSFKFDISFVNRLEFNQLPFTPDNFGSCYFKIDGSKITYHPDNPKNFPESFNGKEYTIEIKEKQ